MLCSLLGLLALTALFLKLPETPDFFSVFACKTCSTSDPYLPLLGAAYFSVLIALSLLFPNFPGTKVARGGLLWATLLAIVLTYLEQPGRCIDCLVGHACNILIWTIWMVAPAQGIEQTGTTVRERLCLTVFAPMSVVALFSCLNLTFMAYGGFKSNHSLTGTTLRAGDAVPPFTFQTNQKRTMTNADANNNAGMVINFVEQDCPYCKEQLPKVEAVAAQLAKGSYRFINVSPTLSAEMIQRAPTAEWVEDKQGSLRQLFHVSGFPTMIVVGNNGKVEQVFSGVPDKLKESLLSILVSPHSN